MRRNPEHTLLDQSLAFYYFTRGLSCDRIAGLIGCDRRTILKWEKAEAWKIRGERPAIQAFEGPLCLSNLTAWLTLALAPMPIRTWCTTNHHPPDPPREPETRRGEQWQRFQHKAPGQWSELAECLHPNLLEK
jgi:hypothetical protein